MTAAALDARSAVVRHSLLENVVGIAVGTLVASFGLYLIDASGAVTGGTAGLVLLLAKVLPLPFGVIYAAVNVPFVVLAWSRKGGRFVAASIASVVLLSAFAPLHSRYIEAAHIDPLYAVLGGSLISGIGILIVLRHHASLGGFNVVALVCQDRLGWRVGHVLLALDALVIALSALASPPRTVLLSAAGVVVLNLVLVMNHRPGRYPAAL
ncbi:putative 5xTM membrane YitT family protein [Actinocorallia herbida]|uniref:Putative 5xTM membrane YitT family protein n=1 Tax=Actinocorallia herbida TaxID=58109 RepID=A0A3N1CW51_9ACTN|nr:YitT family protein [Actinocorallia herbida]ROO85513.1 putative 5xTM membrane YitT family protein [Actinocorallia herbida]